MIDNKKIKEILSSSNIESYTINEDSSIDINDSVTINDDEPIIKYLISGEITINKVLGDFSIIMRSDDLSNASLPKEVYGNFDISFSTFTNLEKSPIYVKGDYNCSFNAITSLKGCPLEINGDFECSMNMLSSLKNSPNIINGTFDFSNNEISSLSHIPFAKKYNIKGNEFTDKIDDENIHKFIRDSKIGDILE